ncbi:MAG: glycoside hydrolase family 3 C-terminal domain-containing protein [Bacteroidetes bacterium]|nr:glycoside hydrolase family 3 C-terminal domain-containing protein [Bacteroidota bacterium]
MDQNMNSNHHVRFISLIVNLKSRFASVALILPVLIFLPARYGSSFAKAGEKRSVNKDYLNPKLPIARRVEDLLSQMTLQEKIGQMCQFDVSTPAKENLVKQGMVGSFLNVTSPSLNDSLQETAVEKSRLGIPLLFGLDVIHGYSTIFPIPLAEASSWDPNLIRECDSVAAEEAHSQGIRWTFSPMINIARDPRWGRIAEGAGEDTYLTMVMAQAQVKGYQGPELSPSSLLLACAKHYVAYGAAEGGRDYNTTDVNERTLRDVYLPAFKAAIEAGAGTVMSAFNDLNGIPASADRFTIEGILKHEWGFKGFVVSDWQSISELIDQGVACDSSEAARKAVTAGVDMDMMGPYHDYLATLVRDGKIPMRLINDAVRRILTIKFKLGLFEHPYMNIRKAKSSLMLPQYLALARKAARESIVLLKNQGEVLPLKKNVNSIAVIGPLANSKEDMLGCWHTEGEPGPVVTLLDGIKSKVSPSTKIIYAEGCGVNDTSTAGFAQALQIGKEADVIVLAVGERWYMTGEAESRAHIRLPGVQKRLVKELAHLGKPVVEILMNGRPLSIDWSAKHVPAILETWFLGTEAGNGIADVLFGDYNPSGKLTVTFPRTVGQVPIYYNHMNTGRPPSLTNHYTSKYIDIPWTPLFPFGYGLSYTRFRYSHLKVAADPKVTDQFIVSVDVTNAGGRSGTEVAQMYYRQPCASVTRPVEQLAGFKRLRLKPGETRTARFTLTPYEYSFVNIDMKRVVESGPLDIMVGGSSVDTISTTVRIPKSMFITGPVSIQKTF